MSIPIQQLKNILRRHFRARLAQLTEEQLTSEGDKLVQRFQQRHFLPNAALYSHVCLFLPIKQIKEVNLIPLMKESLQKGIKTYVPVVLDQVSAETQGQDEVHQQRMDMFRVYSIQDFESFESQGKFEILEPPRSSLPDRETLIQSLENQKDSSNSNVLIMMPGLAFDTVGGRLGRGKGYYDEMLRRIKNVAQQKGNNLTTVALCYSCQKLDAPLQIEFPTAYGQASLAEGQTKPCKLAVDRIPMEHHDIYIDKVYTVKDLD